MRQLALIQERVRRLDELDVDPEVRLRRGMLGRILEEILFHAEVRFWQFTPTHAGAPRFTERLHAWLSNPGLSDEDVSTLLRVIPHIQFIDRDDMLTLYRAAYKGAVLRWLMDQLGCDFSLSPAELDQVLSKARDSTWFCPVTDSMNIAQFNHVNGIAGQSFRPSWRTLKKFGEISRIQEYMQENGLERIVLLEDFVGSGRQSRSVLRFAVEHFCDKGVPVLFTPLVISEFGLQEIGDKIGSPAGLTIEPTFVIPLHVHVGEEPREFEPELLSEFRDLVVRTFSVVRLPSPPETGPLQEEFGYGSVGTLVVLYTNCPNNTVPLIWHHSPQWKPLFPRVSRAL